MTEKIVPFLPIIILVIGFITFFIFHLFKRILYTDISHFRVMPRWVIFIGKKLEKLNNPKLLSFLGKDKVKFSNLSLLNIFLIRVGTLLVVVIMFFLIRLTNMNDLSNYVATEYFLVNDQVYENSKVTDSQEMYKYNLELELELIDQFHQDTDYSILSQDYESMVNYFKAVIVEDDFLLVMEEFAIANIIERELLIQESKDLHLLLLFALIVLFYILVDLLIIVYDKIWFMGLKQELKFMKQQIVLMNSTKGGNFKGMINMLKKRAVFFLPIFRKIEAAMLSNNEDTATIIKGLEYGNDLSLKFFYEDLVTATFSMDEAIHSIKVNFASEQEEFNRRMESRKHLLELIGGIGGLIIIFYSVGYLLNFFMGYMSIDSINVVF